MVAGLFAATPLLAAEHEMMGTKGHMMSTNEMMQNCVMQNEAIGVKIKRLQAEIKTGKKSYSAEDLQKLETKLKEANAMMDMLNQPQ